MKHFDRIIVVEPVSSVAFNRGWIKNVGFLLAQAGPTDSVYFHDVDTLPKTDNWIYPQVPRGTAVHLYGHAHCLGGIVGIDPAAFIYIDGFPHADTWGGEDSHLESACIKNNILIVRGAYFRERFKTSDVVELSESGSIESNDIGKKALKQKWVTYKHIPLVGALSKVEYKLVSLHNSSFKLRHYVIEP